MIDIVAVGEDIQLYDTAVPKAGNILNTQIGDLTYNPTLGINLRYFLSENLRFQNESFRSYLVQVLAVNGISAAAVIETVNQLYSDYTINLVPETNTTSLVLR